MSFLSTFPFPCRKEPPPPPPPTEPTILPPVAEAVALAQTLECGFDLAELNNVTMFLGARRRTIDLLGSLAASVDCAALAQEGYEDFNEETCEFLMAATQATISEGSVCYQAMVEYVEASTDRTAVEEEAAYQMEFNPKVEDLFSVAVSSRCSASDFDCNEIDECTAYESMCNGALAGLTPIIETALGYVFRTTVQSTVGAILTLIGVTLTAKALLATSIAVVAVIAVSTSIWGESYCEDERSECVKKGIDSGRTCEGLACCPGETATSCPPTCCCCPLYYYPSPATCECIRG